MKIRNHAGFAILTELVALALLFISVSAVISLFRNQGDNLRQGQTYSSRDKLLKTIRTYANLATAIRNSIERSGNDALKNCTTAMGSFVAKQVGDCVMPSKDAKYPLTLYGPIVTPQGFVDSSSGLVAGTPMNPVLYTADGQGCATNTASLACPIEVFAEFRPLCPSAVIGGPPVSQCDVAEAIEITYTIQKAPGVAAPNDPLLSAFKTIVDSSVVDVKSITGLDPSIYQLKIDPSPPPISTTTVSSTTSAASTTSTISPTSTTSTTSTTMTSSSGEPPPPPPPFKCPGHTVQVGPNACACPAGTILRNPASGSCSRISI